MKTIKTLTEFAQALDAGEEFEIELPGGDAWGAANFYATELAAIQKFIADGAIRIKPITKTIDMTPFTRNGLDCEFWNPGLEPVISCLQKIDPEEFEPYRVTRDLTWFRFCRPRLDHPFLWSEDIELPEGLEVEYGYIHQGKVSWQKTHNPASNLAVARILGTKENYCFAGEGE